MRVYDNVLQQEAVFHKRPTPAGPPSTGAERTRHSCSNQDHVHDECCNAESVPPQTERDDGGRHSRTDQKQQSESFRPSPCRWRACLLTVFHSAHATSWPGLASAQSEATRPATAESRPTFPLLSQSPDAPVSASCEDRKWPVGESYRARQDRASQSETRRPV